MIRRRRTVEPFQEPSVPSALSAPSAPSMATGIVRVTKLE
jgi:hypothetical protein